MAGDFSTEPEFQAQLDWVEQFCADEIDPVDLLFPDAAKSRDPKLQAVVAPLKQQVKDRELWALFLDEDLGGPGYGQLRLALLNEVLAQHGSAPVIFGTQGPDTGNMFKTTAVRAGHEWVINGEKWFTSFGQTADILLVMCQNGIFIVESDTTGIEWLHDAGSHDHVKRYQPHAGNWPTQFLPAQREAAKKKSAEVLAADPELAARVEAVERDQHASIS